MSGAVFALIVNTAVALLVAGTFLILSRAAAAAPGVRWFAISYAIGAGTPASELLVRASSIPEVFVATSFGTFSLAFHVMAAGLSRYFAFPLPRWLLPASFAVSLIGRAALWNGPRNDLLYEFAYQLPFALALSICTYVLARAAPPRFVDQILTAMFALTALHFLVKPFAAVALGSGDTAREYVGSLYALVSQSLTGILLVAVALSLILVVVSDMLDAARRRADHDELSGLGNRRAFDRDAALALSRRASTALMFDLDHFKSINDTHGHATGDHVIRAFAGLLRTFAPADAVVGRTGGEEFAVLLPGASLAEAGEFAERVRTKFADAPFHGTDGVFHTTVSCGLAVAIQGEALSPLMARCDRALYRAKSEGRDRISVAA